MTGNDLYLELEDAGKSIVPKPDDIAVLRLMAGNEQIHARIGPHPSVPDKRVSYDESLVTHQCHIDTTKRSVRLGSDSSGFSQIEVLVSMNKVLFPEAPGFGGKGWLKPKCGIETGQQV